MRLLHVCDQSAITNGTVRIVGPETREAQTDADGWANFDGVTPGSYEVDGNHPQYQPGSTDADAPSATTSIAKLTLVGAIKIKSVQPVYTVVVDKAGTAPAAFPILTFTITDGPPNHFFDVQVARDGSTPSGGPGISGAWDSSKSVRDRQSMKVYSSWTDKQTSLKLDGSGGATFTMPLEWWRDLARIPLADFSGPITLKYRVVAFAGPGTGLCGTSDPGASPSLQVNNNLVSFNIVDNGYINGGIAKSINMTFTVREADTSNMYTFVQWMQGSFKRWRGAGSAVEYPAPHTLYDIQHISNFPDFTIDRLHRDPRYHDDVYTISADRKIATSSDAPSQGHVASPYTHFYSSIDFETRVHLNFDVPSAVNVYKKEGSAPIWGVVSGNMNPDPITLSSKTWNTRVLEVLSGGVTTLTHDNTFAGP